MSDPILGQSTDGKAVRLDVQRLVETRLLVNANSGGGKSWLLRRILEQAHGKLQHLVIDPEGEFHTLREKFDYVLVARQGGDCLADPRSAGLLAKRLLELGVSAILDIYELHADERKRFVRLFLESLINAPRDLWHPALIVIDEAHVYAPETGDAESAGPVKDLMTRGRKRGFCGLLATQRLSKLHKDASAEANNVLIGRAAQDVDMKRAAYLLGFAGREEQRQLQTLPAGHFFAFGPAISATGVIEIEVGPVVTTHPKAGQRSANPAPPRDTVKRVLAQLADLPQEAAEEAKTAMELRTKIRDLERQLAAKPKPEAPAPQKIERVEVSILKDSHAVSLEKAAGEFATAAEKVTGVAAEIVAELKRLRNGNGHHPPAPSLDRPGLSSRLVIQRPIVKRDVPATGELGTGGLRRIMIALAQCPAGLSAKQIGVRAGMSISSGTFGSYLGKARSSGWIEGSRDRLMITEDGIAALGSYEELPTGRELLEYWLRDLGESGAGRMLSALVEAGKPLTAEELGAVAGISHTSGTFGTYLGKLRTLELVTGSRSELKASEDLF